MCSMASTPALTEPTTSQLWAATGIHQIHGKKLIDLEDVAAEVLFPPHRSAHFFGGCDDDVVAGCARAEGIVPGADAADRPARHPDPRPANFTEIGALFLRQGPRPVLIELNRGAGRDPQMEIKLSMEILQMAMTIDEARQNRLAFYVHDLSVGGNSNFAAPTDCLERA